MEVAEEYTDVLFSSISLNGKQVGEIRQTWHICFLGKEKRKERIELFSPGKRSYCCFGALKDLSPLPSFGASAREELGASLGTPGSPVQRGEHSSTLIA